MDALGLVPELDLDDAASSDPARRARAAAAVREGFGQLGLVAVTSHGLTQADLDATFEAFSSFCDQPEAVKREVLRPDLGHQRGWTPPNTEHAVLASGAPDFKEAYFAAPLPMDPAAKPYWPALLCDNVWPSTAPKLQPSLLAVGRALHEAGLAVLGAAEHALGLDGGALVELTPGAAHLTRALRYLPLTAEQVDAGVLWGEEHTDFNLVTVLGGGRFISPSGQVKPAPDDQSGLFLRCRPTPGHPLGRVVKGQAGPGRLVVQVGQELEWLTGGLFQATPHGILAPRSPGWTRYALAHFVHVHPMRTLAPLPALATPAMLAATSPPTLAGLWSLKTLVDIGLAERDALGWLTRPFDARLGTAP